ncbi:nuclear transport factor 2 family protein [Nocardioides sp.]|uniref:nuclear transport factor 2 family protein n=1 Tax=Nocardioides sp. TaxID=35761 RepID=UPI00261CAE55|nr:nuclear transport factor 2 family protein [Nocardioides sp.]
MTTDQGTSSTAPALLSTADRAEIAELAHRYAAAVDERRIQDVVALFTEDCALISPAPPQHMGPTTEVRGHAGVAEAMAQLGALQATVHAITGSVIDPGADADTAVGRVSCFAHHVMEVREEPLDVVWAVTYRDQYRRTEAGWRFVQRSMSVTFLEHRALKAVAG